ncbi:hypothetical protein DFJ63DRAFT_334397 [Scheffersomyces coipomensis]|uniref:uncharacterized protein n=1 Tax=Scheffersomyces coipomensis TaxID=1788519 RepID=UPI00315CE809
MYIPRDQIVNISKRSVAKVVIPVVLVIGVAIFTGCVVYNAFHLPKRRGLKPPPFDDIDEANGDVPLPVYPSESIPANSTNPIDATNPVDGTPQFAFSPPNEPPPAYQRPNE